MLIKTFCSSTTVYLLKAMEKYRNKQKESSSHFKHNNFLLTSLNQFIEDLKNTQKDFG